jgi:hypothetical protein
MMIQIDLNLLHLNPDLVASLQNATNELDAIHDLKAKTKYIESKHALWHNTIGALAELTSNTEDNCKCWYCECDGAAGFYFQVDHFRPKKRVKNKGSARNEFEPGYWWLAFDPNNYRLACQRCNTGAGKRDQFPLSSDSARAVCKGGETIEKTLLLDPAVPTDPDLLMFTENGDVKATPSCFEYDKKRVETSIKVYNLRARTKREARREIWKECLNAIVIARKAFDELKESLLMSDIQRSVKTKEYQEACIKVKMMRRRNAKFSSTVKSCILEYYKVERAKSKVEKLEFDLDWLLRLL